MTKAGGGGGISPVWDNSPSLDVSGCHRCGHVLLFYVSHFELFRKVKEMVNLIRLAIRDRKGNVGVKRQFRTMVKFGRILTRGKGHNESQFTRRSQIWISAI